MRPLTWDSDVSPAKKRRVHPVDLRDLMCDTCPARYPWIGTLQETVDRARVAQWKIYDGPSFLGTMVKWTFCPQCFGTGSPPRPNSRHVLEGQMDLPGLEAPAPVPKGKRNSREMS